MEQTINNGIDPEDGCITECFSEADRVGVEFTDTGLVKNITAPGSLLNELPPSDYQMGN